MDSVGIASMIGKIRELEKENKIIKEQIEISLEKSKSIKPIEYIANKDILMVDGTFEKGTKTYYCGKCVEFISKKDNYCRICGKKADWKEIE